MKELQDRAYQALQKGEYKTSVDLYQKCIEEFSEERRNYWLLGLSLLLNRQEEDADDVWLSVILQAQADMELWWRELQELLIKEAKSYQSLGHLSEPKIIYQKLIQQEESSENFCNLGSVLADQGDFKESISCYQNALRLNLNNSHACHGIAFSLLELGHFVEAYNYSLKAIILDPNNLQYLIRLAIILKNITFNTLDDQSLKILYKCFETSEINHQNLVGATISILKLDPNFSVVTTFFDIENIAQLDQSQRDALVSLTNNKLFQNLLADTIIADPTFERILTIIRRLILCEVRDHQYSCDRLFCSTSFVSSLSLQCFNNEYVFIDRSLEKEIIKNLKEDLESSIDFRKEDIENKLAVISLYNPLYELDFVEGMTAEVRESWASTTKVLWKRTVSDYFEEQDLKRDIQRITSIDSRISLDVQKQYEENPYPRWIGISALTSHPLSTFLKRFFPHFNLPLELINRPLNLLVAGCGTGAEAISLQMTLNNIDTLAIDLSLASLAYASRKARELKLERIIFRQADILSLEHFSHKFSLISSTGVLHHLENPINGLKILVNLLKPEGLIRIGLYSARARKFVAIARQVIANRGYQNTSEVIKCYRQELLNSTDTFATELTQIPDFYSLSNCRDLMFHVNEHCFTISEIKQMLNQLGLQFIGFYGLHPHILSEYQKMFPDDSLLNDLDSWDKFEETYPKTFLGMYNMWCQKL